MTNNKLQQKWKEWCGDRYDDDGWKYDMVHEFFSSMLTRGQLLDIVEPVEDTARQEGYEKGKAEERDRILEIGDRLKKSSLPNVLTGRMDEVFEEHGIDGVKGWNKAIEAYQSAIKNEDYE